MDKIISFNDLAHVRARHPGKKIVHCHGVFDLFHFGHLTHLRSARRFGDLLVVTITQDRYVNKGPGRPYFTAEQRALMLASLELVDYVAINTAAEAIGAIRVLRPDYYVKGPDYRDRNKDITGAILREEDVVRDAGGQLVFTDDETESSTELLNRYFARWDDRQLRAIEDIKRNLSLDQVLQAIDEFSQMRVLVVGEPIIDTYVFCSAQGLSSKSPTVSARYLAEENYAGGSLAIANHLAALGCQVTLLLTHGQEELFLEILRISLAPAIVLVDIPLHGIPTPRKTRFINQAHAQKIFEVTDLRADQWQHHDPASFNHELKRLASGHDLTVVADFGHGMFENSVLDTIRDIDTFLALNVQSNSGNFGFNFFSKHERYDYISLDEREYRLGVHDRLTPIESLVSANVGGKLRAPASVTMGTGGSMYVDGSNNEYVCPVFFKDVVDTTGAGDAYFCITSLLVKQGVPGALVPFIGNCFAGLKARIIGNKMPVSKVDLVRTLKSILT